MPVPFTAADILMIEFRGDADNPIPYQVWVRHDHEDGGMYDADPSKAQDAILLHLAGGGPLYVTGDEPGRPVYLAPGVADDLRARGEAIGWAWMEVSALRLDECILADDTVYCEVCDDWWGDHAIQTAPCEHLWWCEGLSGWRGEGAVNDYRDEEPCPIGECADCDEHRRAC